MEEISDKLDELLALPKFNVGRFDEVDGLHWYKNATPRRIHKINCVSVSFLKGCFAIGHDYGFDVYANVLSRCGDFESRGNTLYQSREFYGRGRELRGLAVVQMVDHADCVLAVSRFDRKLVRAYIEDEKDDYMARQVSTITTKHPVQDIRTSEHFISLQLYQEASKKTSYFVYKSDNIYDFQRLFILNTPYDYESSDAMSQLNNELRWLVDCARERVTKWPLIAYNDDWTLRASYSKSYVSVERIENNGEIQTKIASIWVGNDVAPEAMRFCYDGDTDYLWVKNAPSYRFYDLPGQGDDDSGSDSDSESDGGGSWPKTSFAPFAVITTTEIVKSIEMTSVRVRGEESNNGSAGNQGYGGVPAGNQGDDERRYFVRMITDNGLLRLYPFDDEGGDLELMR